MNKDLELEDWIFRIKNMELLRAAVNLHTVRAACRQMVSADKTQGRGNLAFEHHMLAAALVAIRKGKGGERDDYPFPTFSGKDIDAMNPTPEALLAYADFHFQYLKRNLAELEKGYASKQVS